ncbi:MAG: dihydropteroate synthase, partial [Nitriliruptoraceae bacterium]
MGVDTPLVRVRDASHLTVDGQVRLVLSRLGDDHLDAVADALTAAGAHHRRVDGRIEVVARPEVVAASLATDGGTDVAAARALVDAAVDARTRGAPDLLTPAGTLPTASRPVVMGVLNVTPDSFSDGGHHLDGDTHPHEAVAAGRAMLAAGADLVDVGGESSRPGAEPVDADEERRRVP